VRHALRRPSGRSAGQPAFRRFGGLLRQHDFRLLWSGETVSSLGNAMAGVAMPLLAVQVLRAGNFAVASISAAAYLPWLIIGLPVGAWVDRRPARPLMIGADVLLLLLYASVPAAWWAGLLTTGQLVAVALLAGSCRVVFQTAYNVYLPALVRPDALIEGNAKLQAGGAAMRIGGPGLGGLLAQAAGPAVALLANAASFAVSAACLARIRGGAGQAGRPPDRRRATVRDDIRAGIRFVATDPFLRPLAVFATLSNFALSGYFALIVVFLVRSAGLAPGMAGALLAAGGVGGLLGALCVGRITAWFGTARGLVLTACGTAPFTLLIPFTGPGARLAFGVLGITMLEGGLITMSVISGSFRQSYCPPEMLARVATSTQMLSYSTLVLGPLVAGGLASWLGPADALRITLGCGLLAATLLLAPRFRKRRDLPVREPSPPEMAAPARL
jgi:MFS family permease